MGEQIESRHELGQIGAKTGEQHLAGQSAFGELGAQPPLERTAAEAHDAQLRPSAHELRQQREQPRVPLALDELRDDADDERVAGQSECGAEAVARGGVGTVTLRVDGARYAAPSAPPRRPRRGAAARSRATMR